MREAIPHIRPRVGEAGFSSLFSSRFPILTICAQFSGPKPTPCRLGSGTSMDEVRCVCGSWVHLHGLLDPTPPLHAWKGSALATFTQ